MSDYDESELEEEDNDSDEDIEEVDKIKRFELSQ